MWRLYTDARRLSTNKARKKGRCQPKKVVSSGEMEGADLRVFLGIVDRFKKTCLATFRQHQAWIDGQVVELGV